jgi:hypothetical protein
MKDDLPEFLKSVLLNHTAERIYASWFNQQREERKRRLHFVMELSIELAKIKEQMTFATGLAELGIESVIEGDWNMVKEWADHFTFNDERDEIRLSSAEVYARFSELLQQCWETRPGVAQGQA